MPSVFPLDTVKDTYYPDDLVKVVIERVSNKNSGQKIPKFLIHVENDVFGLFSDKYTFCSTKSIVDKLENYKVVHKFYSNGLLTVYLEHKQEENLIPVDNDVFQVIKLLSNNNMDVIDTNAVTGIFLVNSYNGVRRLSIGSYLKLKFNTENVNVKLSLSNFDSTHVHTLVSKVDESIDLGDISLETIKNLDRPVVESIAFQYFTKKQIELYNSVMSQLPTYNCLHLLAFVAKELKQEKQLDVLKALSKLINES